MIHWHFGHDGLTFDLNPSAKLLWGETFWAIGGALLLYLSSRSELPWLSMSAAAVSLWAWSRAHRHYRQIADIPTSKLSAAPQGYVEVTGNGEPHPDYPVASPLTGMHCLWYEFTVWKVEGRNSRVINSGTSSMPFSLSDGSGHALVVPEAAKVITRHSRSWREGDEKYHERVLLHNETLYVLGDHASALCEAVGNPHEQQRNALLAEWKSDQTALKKRFDTDGDGHINAPEWEHARRVAGTEALLGKAKAPADEHFIRKPKDGRPFLLSNYSAQQLANRYRRWSWLHLGIFLAVLAINLRG